MRKKYKYWAIAGSAAIAIAATLLMSSQTDPSSTEAATANASSETQISQTLTKPKEADQPTEAAAELADTESAEYEIPPVPYVDENGVIMSYGERVRFSQVADCTETFVQTAQGDWVPSHDCGPKRLHVDHPYGTYTIEQLEYAANEMNDADAAFILAERFAMESWRDRREEAHEHYLRAFLLSSDGEIYARMIADMGVVPGISRTNGEINAAELSASYTMARVGQKFGVVDEGRVTRYAAAAEGLDEIDLKQLDHDAEEIYQTLLAAKGGL